MSAPIRHHLWRRLLVAVAAIALYTASAFTLAMLLPSGAWPPIGDDEYSSGQATTVPALNAFAIGSIILSVVQPALSAIVRIILDVLLAVTATAIGPFMALLTSHGSSAELITPGTLALGAVGIVIAIARTGTAQRSRASRAPRDAERPMTQS